MFSATFTLSHGKPQGQWQGGGDYPCETVKATDFDHCALQIVGFMTHALKTGACEASEANHQQETTDADP